MTTAEERDLRQRLDDAIGRALVDHDYADNLLARPQEELGRQDLADKYATLHDLAQHLLMLFWPARFGALICRNSR